MKYLIFLVIPFLIIGCGKSDEEKKTEQAMTQFVAMQAESHQKTAMNEVKDIYNKLTPKLSKQITEGGDCKDAQVTNTLRSNYIKDVYVNNKCELIITFTKSAFTPELSGQTIKFSFTPATRWKCEFSKTYREQVNFLPAFCQY